MSLEVTLLLDFTSVMSGARQISLIPESSVTSIGRFF